MSSSPGHNVKLSVHSYPDNNPNNIYNCNNIKSTPRNHRKRKFYSTTTDEMTISGGARSAEYGAPNTPTSSSATKMHHSPNSENELNYARLLQYNACYDAMPASSKMVVFDVNLQLRKAFNGLIYQNTRHVLLSEPESDGSVVGILSVTDFIRVLLKLYRNEKNDEAGRNDREELAFIAAENDMPNASSLLAKHDLGRLTIKEYRELIQQEGKLMDLVSINADESLLKAARLLSEHRIHRLPVLDPISGSPLFILTHKRILKFMWLFGQSLPTSDYHEKSCKDLDVGTFTGIRVVFPDTPLVDCLDILLHKGVSGLPVVERNSYKVTDMYSRFDAIGVALEDKLNQLDVTVEQALAFRNCFRDPNDRVVSIYDSDTLWTALTVLVKRNVHRLCVIRKTGSIEGLISLSDVMNYMVVKPGNSLSSSSSHQHRLNHYNSGLKILPESTELIASECDLKWNTFEMYRRSGNIVGSDLSASELMGRLDESAAQLEQRATGHLDEQLAAFSMN